MGKELKQVNHKIQKLLDKKAQIEKDLEPLLIKREELLNQEYVVICRQNKISIEELISMAKAKKEQEKKKDEIETKE